LRAEELNTSTLLRTAAHPGGGFALQGVLVKDPEGRLMQKVIGRIENVKDPCKALKVVPCK
jgi:hypothetical protein